MLISNTIWRKVMTKKTRRRYTAEFKAAAVARLDETGETLSSVAQALGVAATQVKTWRLEQQAAGSAEAGARWKRQNCSSCAATTSGSRRRTRSCGKPRLFSPGGRRKHESEARLHLRPHVHLFDSPAVRGSGSGPQLVSGLAGRRSG